MRRIRLSNGWIAIVDDDDYELVASKRWHGRWNRSRTIRYADNTFQRPRRSGEHRRYGHTQMHRLVMGFPVGREVDHINRNGLDNRRSNLRLATRSQNMANARNQRNAESGFKGVSRSPRSKTKWKAEIRKGGRRTYLGIFDTPEEAAHAYDRAAKKMFGEFARPNFHGGSK